MSRPGVGGGGPAATIENYMRGSDWRGKWRQAAGVHRTASKLSTSANHPRGPSIGSTSTEGPECGGGGPVIVDWRKAGAASGTTPPKRARPWSAEPQWHTTHAKSRHEPWEGAWHESSEPRQGERNWGGGRSWDCWEADHTGGTWQEGQQKSWDDGQEGGPKEHGGGPPSNADAKAHRGPSVDHRGSGEPSPKKARNVASKSPDDQPGSSALVNALRKLFHAKNAAVTAAEGPVSEKEKTAEKPLGGGVLTALLAKQATGPLAKAALSVPSPGSPSNDQNDTELRKKVLTRLLSSDNAGEFLQDPKVVEMLLQVASQLDESGLSDLQKSVVGIVTKLQSSTSSAPPGAAPSTTMSPGQLAKRDDCVDRLKAILEGLRGLFLKRQEERITKANASTKPAGGASGASSHSALASLLSGVSAQNQPIYDHKVWTGHVQRSGVNKAKVNIYTTLPVNSLITDLVTQLGSDLNLRLRVPDTERQNHAESSALLLMKADSAADQAELNAQIAYFNGRKRSGVAKFERDSGHYAAFMIPPGSLAEKLIGTDDYKRCNPDDMATVCMITKTGTNASAAIPH
ncbi:hypothetical protein Pmar_PMAR016149 [Perkinsus marinus ATCC 50983]|uniref:Uncharacterized protein n=1 Tax=Perkinsus marinus (strain ATCC 50983 / TXsc) TaxID=423536 RepID=C5LZ63_PERM5|nr:hypothetical protein Pmar_PMAR016149 [Perkinsus marinus ATCC 50983]EEQ98072.1 hypothetical protein Pmar_PMAR016149 [Perkinsus marinus ATCC 50983]|eukprot:XP_002765355.1 hypothetical protein Pmar_PMAR016149 [Perkinsus marinus ATCC 50983]